MSVALGVALLALLVALFALVALVAVYARVRALEAGRGAELSGYAALVGRPAPDAVRPRSGERCALVAVLDAHCALCHTLLDALAGPAPDGQRRVAVVSRRDEVTAPEGVAVVADPDVRAELFEGYAPTLLAVDAAGRVTHRRFVYADTDLAALVTELGAAGPDPEMRAA